MSSCCGSCSEARGAGVFPWGARQGLGLIGVTSTGSGPEGLPWGWPPMAPKLRCQFDVVGGVPRAKCMTAKSLVGALIGPWCAVWTCGLPLRGHGCVVVVKASIMLCAVWAAGQLRVRRRLALRLEGRLCAGRDVRILDGHIRRDARVRARSGANFDAGAGRYSACWVCPRVFSGGREMLAPVFNDSGALSAIWGGVRDLAFGVGSPAPRGPVRRVYPAWCAASR